MRGQRSHFIGFKIQAAPLIYVIGMTQIYIPRSTPKIDGVEELFMELAKSGPKTGEKSWYDKENS